MSDCESEAQSAVEQLDYDSDAEKGPVKPKKRRVLQKFCSEYAVKFPVVRKSAVGENYAYCLICNSDFSVGRGGLSDVARHVKSSKHAAGVGMSAAARKIENFFADSKDLTVTRAEALFTEFLVEHNIPLACADHAGPLFKKMFPDSNIASKYGCARTKTACVIETLADEDAKKDCQSTSNRPICFGC